MAGRFVCEKCSCSLAWGVDLYVCSRVSVDSLFFLTFDLFYAVSTIGTIFLE